MVKEIKTPYDNPSAELSMAARGGFAQQAVAYRRGYADAGAGYVDLIDNLFGWAESGHDARHPECHRHPCDWEPIRKKAMAVLAELRRRPQCL